MHFSKILYQVKKKDQIQADTISHNLMQRANMIDMVASGIYTWLPIGMRVLKKVMDIVRDEMNKSGAFEIMMPIVQPAELWKTSKRWNKYGSELLRLVDRHERDFCLGPTHEEVITHMISKYVNSSKQLPLNLYQIQTKFRDEIRPRYGVMRSREFVMKDAYSFDTSLEDLQKSYQIMNQTYCNIFDRLGLNYRGVEADSGNIGGAVSKEFHVLAQSGEDFIAFSDDANSQFAANIESIPCVYEPIQDFSNDSTLPSMQKIFTDQCKTIEQVCNYLKTEKNKAVKLLIVEGENHSPNNIELIGIVLRGDHQLNAIKAEKLAQIKNPLTMANEKDINSLGLYLGTIGPVNLNISYIVDEAAARIVGFNCGANEKEHHFTNVVWGRDCELNQIADLRNVVQGDPSPDGNGNLVIKKGIEVGHIFQLGHIYSQAFNANININNKNEAIYMGTYGIGVTRIVAAAIEQNYDEKGIKWPFSLVPFKISILPINYHKNERIKSTSNEIYSQLLTLYSNDIYLDDRNVRFGSMIIDSELLGIPLAIVIGEKGLNENLIELIYRNGDKQKIAPNELIKVVQNYFN